MCAKWEGSGCGMSRVHRKTQTLVGTGVGVSPTTELNKEDVLWVCLPPGTSWVSVSV